jgi:Ala-tRNA(Pro) deacylase
MGVISAAKRVDLNKLRAVAGVSSLSLASPKDVRGLTGCNIGSVPPFGNLFKIQVYADSSLLENEVIAFNAGSHTLSLKMRLEDYLSIVKPVIGEFSEE